MKQIYLDYAATTPTRKEVLEEMLPFFREKFGNPSSIHQLGQETRALVEESREKVAKALGANPEEIVFTSGGTESDNMALKGVALSRRDEGNHIITTLIEHHAVLEAAIFLEKEGFEVTYLPVDKYGIVHPDEVKKALRKETILVSVMHANNEVGTIEPIEEIAQVVKEHSDAYLHTDAVQSVGYLDIDVEKISIDLLSLSSHKFYGPKGVGAIYIRKGVRIFPFMHGGAQENNRRAGTHNVPGIVGLGKAFEFIIQEKAELRERVKSLRDFFIKKVKEEFPDAELAGHPEKRLPNNANFIFPGVEGESLVLAMDLEGVCISSGSACSSGATKPSHVLLALGYSPDKARCCARFTLGKDTTLDEIEYAMEALKKVLSKLRQISPLT